MIDVEQEPHDDEFLKTLSVENCCFCRKPTRFWYRKIVACCQECAKDATPEDVPDKKVWCRREAIAAKYHLEYPQV